MSKIKYRVDLEQPIRRLFRAPEFGPLLAVLFLALFSWPFLGMRAMDHPFGLVLYLFGVWGVLISIHWYQARLEKIKKDLDV